MVKNMQIRRNVELLCKPEENIGVLEHSVFEGHDNELRVFEVRFQHLSYVLGVRQI